MRTKLRARLSSLLLLGLLCAGAVLAHDAVQPDDVSPKQDASSNPTSYFALQERRGLILAHILSMTLAYVFALPVAVMLSLTSSLYTMPSQFVFLLLNDTGVLVGVLYNLYTPDLYPGNAHHSIGWIVTWVSTAHFIVSMIGWVARCRRGHDSTETLPFMRLPTDEEHADSSFAADNNLLARRCRISNDSEQDAGPNTDSLPGNSTSSSSLEEATPMSRADKETDVPGHGHGRAPLGSFAPTGKLALRATMAVSSRLWKHIGIGYKIIDRFILPLGFIAFTTGIVTYGRFFESRQLSGGLAHWMKGGIFFWLGLFTLGRWSGSFGELGWAWNIKPKESKKWRPSAEFVESFLIFFYGSTNIFLEHIGNWGGEWAPQDLEHISITVLFIGGGLVGMLIESTRIRELLNTTVSEAAPPCTQTNEEGDQASTPKTYEFSMNPIPALVIMLLGIMMSSHHQESMISSMVHKQWGNLLVGASVARGLTYMIMWLKPPQSTLPSRPPTELLVSFGLISGGIVFMSSARDCVRAMVNQDLDEMFMYTVTMGLVGCLMAWEILVLALKGWSLRKEQRSYGRRFDS